MAIQERLEDAIRKVARNPTFQLDLIDGHVSGLVIADDFGSMTHLERQRNVWHQIRADLGPEAKDIGLLLFYSPEEADSVLPDDEEAD